MSIAIRRHRLASMKSHVSASRRNWRMGLPEMAFYGVAFLWVGTEHSFLVAALMAAVLWLFYTLLPR
jgi:hypothetical protein